MPPQDVIRFDCESCGKTLKVPAKNAGKKGACPGCKKPIRVPELLPDTDDEKRLAEDGDDWIDRLPDAQPTAARPAQTLPKSGWDGKPAWLKAVMIDEWSAFCTFVFIFIWVLVMLRIVGLDLLHLLDRKSSSSPVSLMGYVYIALGVSVICIPLGLLRTWRSYSILSRGVEVPGWVAKQGMGIIAQGGGSGRKVTVGYEFEGETYTIAITDRLFKKMEEKLGGKPTCFVVIVDPLKPKRALVDERAIQ